MILDLHRLVWLVGFLTSSSTTRLYRGRAPRQSVWQFYMQTELGDHDFYLSRSHYTDTDPTSRERAATAGIEPGTSWPGVARSTDWATAPVMNISAVDKAMCLVSKNVLVSPEHPQISHSVMCDWRFGHRPAVSDLLNVIVGTLSARSVPETSLWSAVWWGLWSWGSNVMSLSRPIETHNYSSRVKLVVWLGSPTVIRLCERLRECEKIRNHQVLTIIGRTKRNAVTDPDGCLSTENIYWPLAVHLLQWLVFYVSHRAVRWSVVWLHPVWTVQTGDDPM